MATRVGKKPKRAGGNYKRHWSQVQAKTNKKSGKPSSVRVSFARKRG